MPERILISKAGGEVFMGIKIIDGERAALIGTFKSEDSALREAIAFAEEIRIEAKAKLAKLHGEQLAEKLNGTK